jgi:hypothetical protein
MPNNQGFGHYSIPAGCCHLEAYAIEIFMIYFLDMDIYG